jgi:hypothetical protein
VVPDTGETLRAGAYRPVNVPEPLRVAEDATGWPVAVIGKGQQAVKTVEDEWRIDDEWWRREPVSRHYFIVQLASGQRLALYKDLASGGWYRQSY